jgi:hypothetical protein
MLPVCVVLLLGVIPSILGQICTSDVCSYTWDVRWATTMTYRTPDGQKAFDVALNGTNLQIVANSYHPAGSDPLIGSFVDPSHVHTADGVKKYIIETNGQFPGPTIEVMEGSEVVIEVTNNLVVSGFSIHWHGIHQLETPWMDGVPYMTQCPILPRQTFTYRFFAYPAGTHWWHSHLKNQRLDGFYGFLLVHKHAPLLPSFTMAIGDWIHAEGKAMIIENPLAHVSPGTGSFLWDVGNRDFSVDNIQHTMMMYKSGLIEGRGRYGDKPLPLKEYHVAKGSIYR